MNRRRFIQRSSLASAGILLTSGPSVFEELARSPMIINSPIVLSTWNFGFRANQEAWEILDKGGKALDAIEKGICLIESDPDNHSVGIGGYPDRDGHVTLDASIMDANGRAGSVTFLQHIMHPISVARMVMDKTPHVMLSGDGALQFALENGFKKENLLTEESKIAWEEWKKENNYQPIINIENHDTIGMIGMDMQGNLSGGCSTSGLAYKMHGRVGDSPIIGAALFVDNEIGAAVTTGLGEMVMRSLSSFLVVELMRNGMTPQEACAEAIGRIIKKNPEYESSQVGILALNKQSETGAYAIQPGFTFAITSYDRNELVVSDHFLK